MRSAAVLRLALVGAFAASAHGAGFGLIEQSASGLGAAFAGSAAHVNDAGVQYFNPAGLALLGRVPQASVAVHAIDLNLDYTDSGSVLPPAGLGSLPRGATSGNAGDLLFVPSVHAALPLGDRLTAGFSLSVPYGLKTQYPDPWAGRFQGILSELKTINLNPSIAWRISEQVSVGAGVSWQKADAELTNAVMLGAATEGRARLDVDGTAWGWNVGVLITPHDSLNIGLGYRSRVDQDLSGGIQVTTAAGAPVAAASGPASVGIDMPEQGYFSLAQQLGDRWTLLLDASVTRWGRIGQVAALNPSTGLPRDLLSFGFEDSVRFALGGEWRLDSRWTLRAGVARDESPVTTGVRTVRLPDASRTWLSAGAQWRFSERLTFDAGFAHLFVQDAAINHTRAQLGGPASFTSIVRGRYESSVNILSVQANYALR